MLSSSLICNLIKLKTLFIVLFLTSFNVVFGQSIKDWELTIEQISINFHSPNYSKSLSCTKTEIILEVKLKNISDSKREIYLAKHQGDCILLSEYSNIKLMDSKDTLEFTAITPYFFTPIDSNDYRNITLKSNHIFSLFKFPNIESIDLRYSSLFNEGLLKIGDIGYWRATSSKYEGVVNYYYNEKRIRKGSKKYKKLHMYYVPDIIEVEDDEE